MTQKILAGSILPLQHRSWGSHLTMCFHQAFETSPQTGRRRWSTCSEATWAVEKYCPVFKANSAGSMIDDGNCVLVSVYVSSRRACLVASTCSNHFRDIFGSTSHKRRNHDVKANHSKQQDWTNTKRHLILKPRTLSRAGLPALLALEAPVPSAGRRQGPPTRQTMRPKRWKQTQNKRVGFLCPFETG